MNNEQECPTLWRLYEYLTEEGKEHTLFIRKDKQTLMLGQGGEGYIADDEWCYNCGRCGHWGDVSTKVIQSCHRFEHLMYSGLPSDTAPGRLTRRAIGLQHS